MDERFKYLVVKFLDHDLRESEKTEFENYLREPECTAYLKKARFANKLIGEGFEKLIAETAKKEIFNAEDGDFPEELIADSNLYGGTQDAKIREEINMAHQKMMIRRKNIRLFIFSSAAAAILVALVFIWPVYFKKTPQQLYTEYYKPHEFLVFRGNADSVTLYKSAEKAYINQYYRESAILCRKILSTQNFDPGVHFLYGLNLMELDSMRIAINQFRIFDSLNISMQGLIYIPEHWYLGLCYLSLGKPDSALIELEILKTIGIEFSTDNKLEELADEIKDL